MSGLADQIRIRLKPLTSEAERPNADPNPPQSSLATNEFRVLDLGCGEGSLSRQVFRDVRTTYCGIDLSRRALRIACRQWPEATWVWANADRTLPAMDESVDLVISLFGRRPVQEIARVLRPVARCVIAVPGEEDLMELRSEVQGTIALRNRWKLVVQEMAEGGLEFLEHHAWKAVVELEAATISDAMAMSYRAFRHSEKDRLERLMETRGQMSVTLSADLMLFRKA